MGLFHQNFDKPGPGVSPNAPRKKGAARYFEVLTRDFSTFWMAGLLAMISSLPFALGLWFAVTTHSLIDEAGYWWVTYRRAWKRNAKAALLPGAICGLLLAMEIFTAFHTETGSVAVMVAIFVALILLAGIAQYLYAQVALVDLPFSSLLKNSLMLFLGYLPRSALGILWQGLYWAAIALFWPLSGAVLILTSLWFPCSLSLLAIYPALNKSFDLEAKIKAMRDAQLDSHDED